MLKIHIKTDKSNGLHFFHLNTTISILFKVIKFDHYYHFWGVQSVDFFFLEIILQAKINTLYLDNLKRYEKNVD